MSQDHYNFYSARLIKQGYEIEIFFFFKKKNNSIIFYSIEENMKQ